MTRPAGRMAAAVLLMAGTAARVVAGQDAPGRAFRFTADLSFVDTGGNTDLVTLSAGEKIEYDVHPRLGLQQHLAWVYGETDGERSANQLQSGLRAGVALGDRVSAFAGMNYEYDLFAGVKRRFEELVGLGYTAVDRGRHRLGVEAGLSFLQEAATDGVSESFVAGRAAVDYRLALGEKASVQQTLEYLANFETGSDYRLNSETAVVAPLAGVFALKAAYVVRYRGSPPAGFENTDTVFRTGIQVTL